MMTTQPTARPGLFKGLGPREILDGGDFIIHRMDAIAIYIMAKEAYFRLQELTFHKFLPKTDLAQF